MSLFRTFAMLGSAVLAVLFFYSIGYAIATRETLPALMGVGYLAVSIALAFLQQRIGKA
ncbi:MAG: hypothetical protein ACRELX_02740 [Longimicrobiales bacterium]